MNKNISKILSLILALVLSLSFAVYAFATEGITVYDGADLLTEEEEANLTSLIDSLTSDLSFNIAVVTVEDYTDYDFYGYGENSMEEFADDYYDIYFGYESDGVVFAISMYDRSYHISTCGYGITAITDDGIEYIENAVLDYLSNGEYYNAFSTFASTAAQLVSQAKSGNVYELSKIDRIKEDIKTYLIAALVVGFIVAFAITSDMKGKLKTVAKKADASNYVVESSLNLTNQADVFLYSNVVAVPKPKDPPSNSGGSSTHSSSSGGSHGGGGGHF